MKNLSPTDVKFGENLNDHTGKLVKDQLWLKLLKKSSPTDSILDVSNDQSGKLLIAPPSLNIKKK